VAISPHAEFISDSPLTVPAAAVLILNVRFCRRFGALNETNRVPSNGRFSNRTEYRSITVVRLSSLRDAVESNSYYAMACFFKRYVLYGRPMGVIVTVVSLLLPSSVSSTSALVNKKSELMLMRRATASV